MYINLRRLIIILLFVSELSQPAPQKPPGMRGLSWDPRRFNHALNTLESILHTANRVKALTDLPIPGLTDIQSLFTPEPSPDIKSNSDFDLPAAENHPPKKSEFSDNQNPPPPSQPDLSDIMQTVGPLLDLIKNSR